MKTIKSVFDGVIEDDNLFVSEFNKAFEIVENRITIGGVVFI